LTERPTRPASLRTPLTGVSALVVFGLLLSVSLHGAKPALGEPRRDPTERISVRQTPVTVAKASRNVGGSETHKPCARLQTRTVVPSDDRTGAGRPLPDRVLEPGPMLLRAALLDLPPPACRA
jgi:hypothetical protein